MESVLVGVDSSDSSRRALAFALRRAQINDWKVCVTHVVNWSRYTISTLEENEKRPVKRKGEIKRAKASILEPLLHWAETQGYLDGVSISSDVQHGRPSEVLSDIAERKGHDLIVVGRTGDSNLKTAIFGSTASRLVQHAPVPVVVVP